MGYTEWPMGWLKWALPRRMQAMAYQWMYQSDIGRLRPSFKMVGELSN